MHKVSFVIGFLVAGAIYAPLLSWAEETSLTNQPVAPKATGVVAQTENENSPNIRITVRELRRTVGSTVTLKGVIINDTDDKYASGRMEDFYLADLPNRKKYTVIRSSIADCETSVKDCSALDIGPKSQRAFYARYPAPPPNVNKISVVIPGFMPMDEVPISP
jgi:hypothetical protein